jgi:DNA repair protein RecO (recombination protein O)
MDWRDEGLLLSVRRHGESSAIIEVLTAGHGRHAGLVHGGGGRKLSAVLQPGTQLSLAWRARLEDHLGTYRVEPVQGRAAGIMACPARLAALNALAALCLATLPEREPLGQLYDATVGLADSLAGAAPDWPARYARWELTLLAELGFGLDLARCAATGTRDQLIYVSPRTGRAVSRQAGGPWADRLLPLPAFLAGGAPATMGAVREALRLTGHFLEAWVRPALGAEALPEARGRLLERLDRFEMPAGAPAPDPNADEREWHRSVGSEGKKRLMLPY